MGLARLESSEVEKFRSLEDKIIKNFMDTITLNLGERSYPVYIGPYILSRVGECLSNYELSKKIAIVSNPAVWKFYGTKITKSLKSAGFSTVKIIIPDGERYKNLKTVEKIYTEMLKAGIDRGGCVVALGGGVIGDIAGFVSATYMRGIKYIQVPTTLLAQVDASIGGKTGVDHKLGKNLIGAFHQPLFVLSDIETLRTLPEREYKAGLAEVIKYGVIKDAELFEFMDKESKRVLDREEGALTYIVRRCSEIKAEVVERDEREETGIRSILNFGHTIGHAIESATKYRKYLHGEAVAMGMVVEAGISDNLTGFKFNFRIKNAISKYFNNEVIKGARITDIINCIQHDKKKIGDYIKLFVIRNIGDLEIQNIKVKEMKKFLLKEVKHNDKTLN